MFYGNVDNVDNVDSIQHGELLEASFAAAAADGSASRSREDSIADALPDFGFLRGVLLRRGCSNADAEDLIQDAFPRMLEYCQKGGHVRQPECFLMRTALRLAINARRDEHREMYCDQQVEAMTFLVDGRATPHELLVANECLLRITNTLDSVSPRTREILFMHRLEGLSHAEIARQLGLSISAVEKHIARASSILAEKDLQRRLLVCQEYDFNGKSRRSRSPSASL